MKKINKKLFFYLACLLGIIFSIYTRKTPSELHVEILSDASCKIHNKEIPISHIRHISEKKIRLTDQRVILQSEYMGNTVSLKKMLSELSTLGFFDYYFRYKNIDIPVRTSFSSEYSLIEQSEEKDSNCKRRKYSCFSILTKKSIPVIEINREWEVDSLILGTPVVVICDLSCSQNLLLEHLYQIFIETQCVSYLFFR